MFGFGFFLYNVLDRFNRICSSANLREYIEKYEKIKNDLKIALNSDAWDGEWFKRAFTDERKNFGNIEKY
ncbi:MAG: hypothetical protein HFJ50_03930 [Clostridia bacterium]|nr:hypothetical protein [Clostridia bacterium]